MDNLSMSEKIKMLRERSHLTLEEVAKRVGVTKSTVRKWEVGMIANMRRDKIASLAKALNTSPEYLMGWEEEPTPAVDPKTALFAELISQLTPEDLDKVLELAKLLLMAEQNSKKR